MQQEQLIKLIEMYAAARASNNQDLSNLAATQLNEFLSKVFIGELPPKQPPAPAPEAEAPTEE